MFSSLLFIPPVEVISVHPTRVLQLCFFYWLWKISERLLPYPLSSDAPVQRPHQTIFQGESVSSATVTLRLILWQQVGLLLSLWYPPLPLSVTLFQPVRPHDPVSPHSSVPQAPRDTREAI